MQKIMLPIAGEPGEGLACGIMVPEGFEAGKKDGETVLFRKQPRVVNTHVTPLGSLAEIGVLVDGKVRYVVAFGAHAPEARKELAEALRHLAMTGDLPGKGGGRATQGAEWRGLAVEVSEAEAAYEQDSPEPLTATEVAGSLGTLGEEQVRTERNRAAFEQAKNTMSGHNMAPRGFEPISACRCEKCRRHRGETL